MIWVQEVRPARRRPTTPERNEKTNMAMVPSQVLLGSACLAFDVLWRFDVLSV